jgi:hypothetical protein
MFDDAFVDIHVCASKNLFCGRIAVSRARSFLVYQSDMPRHSLRGSLRFIPQNEFLEAHIFAAANVKREY